MSWMSLTAAALGALSLLVLLRRLGNGTAEPLSAAVCVFLLGGSVALFSPTVLSLRSMLSGTAVAGYLTPVFKGMGTVMITQTAADVCRDCGESAVASGVETVGRAELLAICLPLIKEICAAAVSLSA